MYEQEEEDLEALRLAALKTLQCQKKPTPIEHTPSHIQPSFPQIQVPPIEPYLPIGNPGSWDPTPYHPRVIFPQTVPYTPVIPGMIPAPTIPPIVPLLPSISSVPLVPPSTSNVQLSPRSAAFVSKNNDILARRKQAKSPFRSTGRWSRSPSPFGRKYRRSISRSPSPKIRRRSRSRSPKYNRRRRSPVRSPPRNNYTNGHWRSANNSPIPRKRTRSPPPRSPCGGRRFNRNFKTGDRDRKRKTPEQPKPKEPKIEGKQRSKSKSLSPAASLERILANMDEEYKIDFCDDKTIEDDDLLAKIDSAEKEELHLFNKKIEQIHETEKAIKPEKIEKKHKSEIDMEDELLASDDEVLNLSPDLDLFASEESESENEGRFKSGTVKTDRKTTSVVPFSKLLGGSVKLSDQRQDDGRRRNEKRIEAKREEKPDSRPKVSSTVSVNKNETKKENKRDERRIIRRPITAPKNEDPKEYKDSSRKPIRLSGRLGDIVADKDRSAARTLTSTIARTKTKITWRSEKV